MKPNKLVMINIGPFAGRHVVDFSELDSIYVITGKTGSGKTTILDCITYALYGMLPGARKKTDKRHLRSDYCTAEDECRIEFDFSIHDKCYRVTRILPVKKLTKKGTQKEAEETAELYHIENNENNIESIQQDLFSSHSNITLLESQKAKVDSRLRSILVLSAEEFSRIVLLPQGEFATFLRQSSNERKEILSKLFPIDAFTRITEKIKQERTTLEIQLKEITSKQELLQNTFNPDTAEEELKTHTSQRIIFIQQLDEFQQRIAILLAEAEALQEKSKKIETFNTIKEQLESFHLQKNEIDAQEINILRSIEAEKIIPFINNYTQYEKEYKKNTEELTSCKEQLESVLHEKNIINTEIEKFDTWKNNLKEIAVALHDLERCLGLQENIKKNKQELLSFEQKAETCKNNIQQLQSTITSCSQIIETEKIEQENLENSLLEQKMLSHSLLLSNDALLAFEEKKAQDTYNNSRLILDDMEHNAELQKMKNIASSLAVHLIDGNPCPVCGSTDHPNPIEEKQSVLETSDKIDMQKKLVEQVEDRLQDILDKRKKLSWDIDKSKESLQGSLIEDCCFSTQEEYVHHKKNTENNLQKKQEEILIIEKKAASIQVEKEKMAQHSQLLQPLEKNIQELHIEIAKITTIIQQQSNELKDVLRSDTEEKSIEQQITALQAEQTMLQNKSDLFEKRKTENDNSILRLTEKISMLEKTLKSNSDNQGNAQAELLNALAKAESFYPQDANSNEELLSKLQTIEQALLPNHEKQRLQEKVASYKKEVLRLETLYAQMKDELQTTENTLEQDQLFVQEQLHVQKALQAETQENFTKVQQRITNLEHSITEYSNTEARRKEIASTCETITKLHKAISGDNAKKIPLDSWILSMYLQEITLYANARLSRMSDGRFQMHLKQDAEGGNAHRGLDIEIYDDYTGKARPASTLSGGETFMASISLALAISDMVQEQNGGIQLDSMFIDEGFGSLDADSLEKALGILDEIRETRSVALISHVETLQTRITSQIRVNKFAIGSTVEVCNSF